jgi:hypothetical protein
MLKYIPLTTALVLLLLAPPVLGSSHREAPLLTEDPAADATDLYVFRSPQSDGSAFANSVTILANYWPLEEPGSGPNWPRFSDQVLYEIKIDNDGDAREDITYQFRFRTEYRNPGSFLLTRAPVQTDMDPSLQVVQRMTLTRIDKSGRKVLLKDVPTPPVLAGDYSMPGYQLLVNAAIYDLPEGNGRAFAGPRDDPFFADLGAIFDLVRVRCQAAPNDPAGCGGNANPKRGVDYIAGYNVHTLALQVPIQLLSQSGAGAPTGKEAIIGVWTTASRPRVTIRRAPAAPQAVIKTHDAFGPFVQVSRLGLPLINEVLVPVGLKDFYSTTPPQNDAALFTSNTGMPLLTNPELAQALKALYNLEVPSAGRTDLLDLTQFHIAASDGGAPIGPFRGKALSLRPADILRLDVSLPPPRDLSHNPLGLAGVVFGGATDPNIGFPNGRRPHDDVMDIALSVVSGVLRGKGALLGDGVAANDRPLLSRFPYLAPPWSGSQVGISGAANPRLHQSDQGPPQ